MSEPLPTSDPEPRLLALPHGPVAYVDEGPRGAPALVLVASVAFSLQLRALGATDFERLKRAACGPLPPALVAYSRDDHMVETHISEELARGLPHASVLAFEGGGHNLQKTRAVELAQAIKRELGVR